MKNLSFVLMAVFGLVMTAPAQNNQYASAADSDPEARAVLDKLRKKYDSYHSMQAEFSLTIELPEQPAEIQQGTLSRQGEKYRLKMAQQEIISDGETL